MQPYRLGPPTKIRCAPPRGLGPVLSRHPMPFGARLAHSRGPIAGGAAVLFSFATLPVLGSLGGVLVVAAAFGLLIAYAARQPVPQGADLHEGGVVMHYRSAFGQLVVEERVEILFEDIDEIRLEPDGAGSSSWALRLRTVSGTVASVSPELERASVIFEQVDRACSQPLLEPAQEVLDRGQRLQFGPVMFDRDAIAVSNARKTWSAISRVQVEGGYAELFTSDGRVPWLRVALTALPHPQLFCRLIPQLAPHALRGPLLP